jgi:hypothetical protein
MIVLAKPSHSARFIKAKFIALYLLVMRTCSVVAFLSKLHRVAR